MSKGQKINSTTHGGGVKLLVIKPLRRLKWGCSKVYLTYKCYYSFMMSNLNDRKPCLIFHKYNIIVFVKPVVNVKEYVMGNEKPETKKMKILIPTTKIADAVKCKNTEQAYYIFRDLLEYEKYELKDQEHFWVMGIDQEEYVVCVYIAAIGAENRATLDPLDMFATAINHKSRRIILAHNHPAAYDAIDLCIEDFDFTDRLYHACLPFGLEILDHIILADKTYYGFSENQFMEMIYESLKYKTYIDVKPRIDKEKEDCRNEGLEEGLEEGEEIGIEKRNIEIAKSMLKKNYTLEQIIEITGLSKKEINKLK